MEKYKDKKLFVFDIKIILMMTVISVFIAWYYYHKSTILVHTKRFWNNYPPGELKVKRFGGQIFI